MTGIDPIDQDKHAARLVADHAAGLMSTEQAMRIAIAVGRLQGHYMSAYQLAHEAGIVCDFNSTRKEKVNHEQ